MKILHMVAFILLVVGGLNWLLVAFGYNLVDMIFGGTGLSLIFLLPLSSRNFLLPAEDKISHPRSLSARAKSASSPVF